MPSPRRRPITFGKRSQSSERSISIDRDVTTITQPSQRNYVAIPSPLLLSTALRLDRVSAPSVDQGGRNSHKTSGAEDAAGNEVSSEAHPDGTSYAHKHNDCRRRSRDRTWPPLAGTVRSPPRRSSYGTRRLTARDGPCQVRDVQISSGGGRLISNGHAACLERGIGARRARSRSWVRKETQAATPLSPSRVKPAKGSWLDGGSSSPLICWISSRTPARGVP